MKEVLAESKFFNSPKPSIAVNPPKCEKCKDSGIVSVMDENGGERWRECVCAVKRMQEQICLEAGFDVEHCKRIADYEEWNETAKIAKEKAVEFVMNFHEIRKKRKNWFVFFGQSGSGKTMLCNAIIRALIHFDKPVQARAVKYFEMMYRLKSHSNDEDYARIIRGYTDIEVLFIDDFLKDKSVSGTLTEADIKHLFTVIDTRYNKGKPTLITTECTPIRLSELDEAIFYRIHETAFAEIVSKGSENNYRKRL